MATKIRRLRGTHETAKAATFIKELSLKMLPRSGQRGRTSHKQLGFVTLTAKSNGSYTDLSLVYKAVKPPG